MRECLHVIARAARVVGWRALVFALAHDATVHEQRVQTLVVVCRPVALHALPPLQLGRITPQPVKLGVLVAHLLRAARLGLGTHGSIGEYGRLCVLLRKLRRRDRICVDQGRR